MATNSRRKIRSDGFTAVELLVVIAIVGVILGLILPAMQQTRRSALRVECLNNLRQLGLALHNYESNARMFPPGYVTRFDVKGNEVGPGWGWATQLLPYMEQTAVAQTIAVSADVLDPANSTIRGVHIRAFLCPTDRPPPNWSVREGLPTNAFGALLGRVPSSSYVGVAGIGPIVGDSGGFFRRNEGLRFAEVLDGMSQTLAIGERGHALGLATWIAAIPSASLCPEGNPDDVRIGGASMVLGAVAPDGRTTAADGFRGDHGIPGAQFVFGDGSVRFLGDSIDPALYRALASRSGGEMISDDE